MLKLKKLNSLPFTKVTFQLPDYTPKGDPMPDTHEELQAKLTEEFEVFFMSFGEVVLKNELLNTDPVTVYTVYLSDNLYEVNTLLSFVHAAAKELMQTEFLFERPNGEIDIYKV